MSKAPRAKNIYEHRDGQCIPPRRHQEIVNERDKRIRALEAHLAKAHESEDRATQAAEKAEAERDEANAMLLDRMDEVERLKADLANEKSCHERDAETVRAQNDVIERLKALVERALLMGLDDAGSAFFHDAQEALGGGGRESGVNDGKSDDTRTDTVAQVASQPKARNAVSRKALAAANPAAHSLVETLIGPECGSKIPLIPAAPCFCACHRTGPRGPGCRDCLPEHAAPAKARKEG